MDDVVVKTKRQDTLIEDLRETFGSLRKVHLMLNPEKCTFGVPSGKLLGFLVSHRGIEANPDKIRAIEEMQPPRRIKDVQRLNGCITALGRFISRLGERALPFFKLLKKKGPSSGPLKPRKHSKSSRSTCPRRPCWSQLGPESLCCYTWRR